MYVDYFRFYELSMDCANNATLVNQTQYDAYVPQVKQNITIGNNSTSISTGSADFFRFTTGITINGTFTVPVGEELKLLPTPCY